MPPSRAKPAKSLLNNKAAELLVRRLWAGEGNVAFDEHWKRKIEQLSELCANAFGKTHIAMLGAAILAKAVDPSLDLKAFKPKHAPRGSRSYSARTLCHGVLVPLAAEYGFHLGATGREPLNNQPYFRMRFLGDETPIHPKSAVAFKVLMDMIHELQELRSESRLLSILLKYLRVRAEYQPRFAAREGGIAISPDELIAAIVTFVEEDSESGKRAQAVTAGLIDIFAGAENVESGKINDPSRDYPGDVCVRAPSRENDGEDRTWLKAFEVRDKPVSMADIRIFGQRCISNKVFEAAVVMVSKEQVEIDLHELTRWSNEFGLGMTLFVGWQTIVDQALFWSEPVKHLAAARAVLTIEERLILIEVSERTVEMWRRLTNTTALAD